MLIIIDIVVYLTLSLTISGVDTIIEEEMKCLWYSIFITTVGFIILVYFFCYFSLPPENNLNKYVTPSKYKNTVNCGNCFRVSKLSPFKSRAYALYKFFCTIP